MKTARFFILVVLFALNEFPLKAACPSLNMTLSRQSQIDSFPIMYPGCTDLNIQLMITGSDITNLNGLNALKHVRALVILGNDLLTSLNGLNNLVYTEEFRIILNSALTSLRGLDSFNNTAILFIDRNPVLADLQGLNSLRFVSLDFTIHENQALRNFKGLDKLMNVKNLNVDQNASLVNFAGMDSLRVLNSFNITYNTSLINLRGLDKIQTISQDSRIDNNALVTLDGLNNLKTSGSSLTISHEFDLLNLNALNNLVSSGSLIISNCFRLQNLNGLNNLKTINNDLQIISNIALSSLQGLNGLQTVGRYMNIDHNPVLMNLTGLSSLQIVGDITTIQDNRSLLNFSGLSSSFLHTKNLAVYNNMSLETLSGLNPSILVDKELDIYNNPKLSCCYIAKRILENNPSIAPVIIHDNNSGCNSEAEVRALTAASCCVTTNIVARETICQGNGWTVGSHTYTVTGIYKDTIHVGPSCDSIITTNLIVLPKFYQIQTKNLCSGQIFTLSNGRVIATTGIFNDTLPAQCDSIIEYHLNFMNNITVSQNVSLCRGKSYTLPNGNTVDQNGIYRDTLLSSFGCDSIVITNLLFAPYLTSEQFDSICSGQSYTLPSGRIVNSQGIYLDTLKTKEGCDSVITTHLNVYPNNFIVGLSPSTDTIKKGQALQLIPEYVSGHAISWSWAPNTGLSCSNCEAPFAMPFQTTFYIVTVTSDDHCTDTAGKKIFVDEPQIFVPSAFSPNGDGLNDVFGIFSIGLSAVKISVFNRWGELVFETDDINKGWDGTFKGKNSPIDDYTYMVIGYIADGSTITKKGTVTLLR